MPFMHLTIVVSTLVSIFVCLPFWNIVSSNYDFMILLPMVFLLVYGFVYAPMVREKSIRLSVATIILFSWLRCAIMPAVGSLSGYYMYLTSYSTVSSTRKAIILMAIEQIVIAVFLLFITQGKRRDTKPFEPDLKMHGSIPAYLVFIVFAIAFFVVYGETAQVEFFIKSVAGSGRSGDSVDTAARLATSIFKGGLLYLFIIITEKMRQAYERKDRSLYVNIALLGAVFLVGVIVGERRSSQIYTTFCTIWLLARVFPARKKRVVITVVAAAGFVLAMLSIYKFFNAFLYDSYSTAFGRADVDLYWLSSTLDSYFYGIRAVSRNIGFADIANLGIKNFFFDIGRSTFGLSFFIKSGGMMTTSELYNSTLYGGSQNTGMLFSSVAYGYEYFGFLFAPLVTCINVWIIVKLEGLLRRCRSIEMNYILSYVFVRFAFGVFANPAPLISTASTFFVINVIVFLAGLMFVTKSKYQVTSEKQIPMRVRG